MYLKLLLLICATIGLSAQTFTFLDMGQWTEGKFIWGGRDTNGYNVFDFKENLIFKQHVPYALLPNGQSYPDGTNRTTFDGNNFSEPKTYDFSVGQSSIFLNDWKIYTNVWGGKPKALQLVSFINNEWVPQAELDVGIGGGVILPLRNGNFLVGLPDGHQVDKNKHDSNPFGIYKKNPKGKLEFLSIIDFVPNLKNISMDMVTSDLAFTTSSIAITEDHYTYINPEIGMLWTFSINNGRLTRFKSLYPRVIEALDSGNWIVPVIIWAQPTNDGEILISAWSDKLCIEGGKFRRARAEMVRAAQKIDEELFNNEDQLHDSIIAIDPVVKWYKYNPTSGALVKEVSAPKGGKDFFESSKDYDEYRYWCLNGEGTELFYIDMEKLRYLHPEKKLDLSKTVKQFSTYK